MIISFSLRTTSSQFNFFVRLNLGPGAQNHLKFFVIIDIFKTNFRRKVIFSLNKFSFFKCLNFFDAPGIKMLNWKGYIRNSGD